MTGDFVGYYPEFIRFYQILPTEAKDWLNQFFDKYKFDIMLSKFLDTQLTKKSHLNDAVSNFMSHAVFYTGSIRLINRLISEDAINLFSSQMGYLLVSTLGKKLPRLSSITPIMDNIELLIIMAWSEWREGRYERVIGLLSNITFDAENNTKNPLFSCLYVFLLLSSYLFVRDLERATIWKNFVLRLLKNPRYINERFLSALLEMALGIWYNHFGELQKTRKHLENSWSKFEVFTNYYFIFYCGETLGLSYHKEKNYWKAYDIFYSILRKRDEIDAKELDPLHVYRVETNLANLSYDLGNMKDAIIYAQEAFQLYKQFKIPSLNSVFTLSEFYAVSGEIDKARKILNEGISTDWIPENEIKNPDFFRVQGTIEKYACNFTVALEHFKVASDQFKKIEDLNNLFECMAEIIILNLEIFFWRRQNIILDQAIETADELRLLVKGQELTGWSYISKIMQTITSAYARKPDIIQLVKDAENSHDFSLFSVEHEKLMKSVDLDILTESRVAALKVIEFLTSLLHIAHRDKWAIEETSSNLLYLLVLDSESSLPVFVYYFSKEFEVDRILISGLISAMNTISQSLKLKELNEIKYRDTLVLVGHKNPLIFALVCDGERTTIGLRVKLLQLTEIFPKYSITETPDVGQIDLSDSQELRSMVEKIFLKT